MLPFLIRGRICGREWQLTAPKGGIRGETPRFPPVRRTAREASLHFWSGAKNACAQAPLPDPGGIGGREWQRPGKAAGAARTRSRVCQTLENPDYFAPLPEKLRRGRPPARERAPEGGAIVVAISCLRGQKAPLRKTGAGLRILRRAQSVYRPRVVARGVVSKEGCPLLCLLLLGLFFQTKKRPRGLGRTAPFTLFQACAPGASYKRRNTRSRTTGALPSPLRSRPRGPAQDGSPSRG